MTWRHHREISRNWWDYSRILGSELVSFLDKKSNLNDCFQFGGFSKKKNWEQTFWGASFNRPNFYISYGPSSQSVREVNGLTSSTRPSGANFIVRRPNPSMRWTVHGQKFVHSSTLKFLCWSSVRIRPWGWRFVAEFRYVAHLDEWTVRRRSSSSVKAWTGVLICFLTINFETDRDQSSFETLPLLIFINSSHNDLDETWWDNPGACKVLIVVFRIFKSHQFGVGNRSSWSSYFNQLKRSCGVFEG